MTLQDIDEFREMLDDWFSNMSADTSREILSEMSVRVDIFENPPISEDLEEIRQLMMYGQD